jgi:PKD repeat protein
LLAHALFQAYADIELDQNWVKCTLPIGKENQMNATQWTKRNMAKATIASVIAVLSMGGVKAGDLDKMQYSPEACADYHQFTPPQTLDSSTNNNSGPRWSEVRLDSQGFYHVAYQSNSGVMMYGTNKTGSFVTEHPVSSGQGTYGLSPSLAIDANDKVHIVYGQTSGRSSNLYYVTNKTGTWSAPILVKTGTWGPSSLAFDRVGTLHIVFIALEGSTYELYYNTWNGSAWNNQYNPDYSSCPFTRPTLLFAPDNQGLFSYEENCASGTMLKRVKIDADGYPAQYFDSLATISANSLSQAMDQQGHTYFAYMVNASGSNYLEIQSDKTGSWQVLLSASNKEYPGNLEGTSIGINMDGTGMVVFNSDNYPDNASMVVIPASGCGNTYSTAIKSGEYARSPQLDASKPQKAHLIYGDYSYILKHSETTLPTCILVCTASASPTTGAAPLTVNFVATATPANCTGSPTFSWVFGDGQTSTQQNPSHTFSSAGTYTWVMTTSVSGVTCSKTGSITVNAPICTLACTANASPTSGMAPLAVNFTSTVTPSTCTGTPTYSWTFGDGQTSILQNPSHTYTSNGTKNWGFTVTQAGVSCSKSGSITVGAGGLPGDCDGNGTVTIGEVQKVINAFLGLPATCP